MRIATFNILHGRSLTDGVVDPERLHRAVRSLDADVLALQEVDHRQPRSGGVDLTAVAAAAMGAVDSHFVAALAGTPGEAWVAARGSEPDDAPAYGIALLSRHPVRSWSVLRLSRLPVRVPLYVPDPGRVVLLREEPRVAVSATIDSPLGTLTVANTHLSFVPGWNRVQLRRVRRHLLTLDGPHVLLGDLNCTPPTPQRHTGWHALGAAPTFPSGRPTRQLDHVLTDDPRLEVVACSTPDVGLSDHRPLVVDLQHRHSGRRGLRQRPAG